MKTRNIKIVDRLEKTIKQFFFPVREMNKNDFLWEYLRSPLLLLPAAFLSLSCSFSFSLALLLSSTSEDRWGNKIQKIRHHEINILNARRNDEGNTQRDRERERERYVKTERKKERKREREREREKERKKEWEKETETERKRERQAETETEKERDRDVEKEREWHIEGNSMYVHLTFIL